MMKERAIPEVVLTSTYVPWHPPMRTSSDKVIKWGLCTFPSMLVVIRGNFSFELLSLPVWPHYGTAL